MIFIKEITFAVNKIKALSSKSRKIINKNINSIDIRSDLQFS